MIVFSWFGRRVLNRAGGALIMPRHRNVFWGYSKGSVLLAKNILDTSLMQQVLFVLPEDQRADEDKDRQIFEELDRLGAVVIYKNFDAVKTFPKARRQFFLGDDQDLNVYLALNVSKSIKSNANSLYIRTETQQAWSLFRECKAELYFFNQSDLTARKFVKDYPMLDIAIEKGALQQLRVNYHFNVLLLGFGCTGREVLNKIICDSQFVGSHFQATIIDNDFGVKHGDYPVLFSECIEQYHLDFNPIYEQTVIDCVGHEKFYKWMDANLEKFDRIVVTLGDDCLNLNVAQTISRIVRIKCLQKNKNFIFAHVREPEKYKCFNNQLFQIGVFGGLEGIYSREVVIAEQLDVRAKATNYVYAGGDTIVSRQAIEQNAEPCWRKTEIVFNKDSSRASAANMDNILKLAGDELNLQKAIENPQLLDILAETEHKRWNAFHFTQGIRKWDAIPNGHKTDAKLFSIIDDKKSPLMKHACLVDYKDLNFITDSVNKNRMLNNKFEKEDFQETDRRIIRNIPTIIHITELTK